MTQESNPTPDPNQPVVPPPHDVPEPPPISLPPPTLDPISQPAPTPPVSAEFHKPNVETVLSRTRQIVLPILGVILIAWSLIQNQPGLLIIGAGLVGSPGMVGITSSMTSSATKETFNGPKV